MTAYGGGTHRVSVLAPAPPPPPPPPRCQTDPVASPCQA
eukprot:COSAG03_NODE_1210_length_4553_cov_9.402784_7_plen_38_part_01